MWVAAERVGVGGRGACLRGPAGGAIQNLHFAVFTYITPAGRIFLETAECLFRITRVPPMQKYSAVSEKSDTALYFTILGTRIFSPANVIRHSRHRKLHKSMVRGKN
ncbi:Uncharacterised protein [Corynebacterium renale]|uniref:Uncharacterized protein n=1 Tax=Corynebacterium renale TaxID=1724 RepID=A0A2A9DPF3_9CORY|nr:hypothetical protein ATK06_0879 [Corynebacterium renale]SQI22081.1 Uncharacterised protein [Corynebacterium renale]